MSLDARVASFAREIARGSSVATASAALGINDRTGFRWLAQAEVRAEIERIRERSTALLTDRLADLATEAVTALRGVLTDDQAAPTARVGAARAVLDLLLRHREAAEVAGRLDAVEAAVSRGLASKVGGLA